MTTKGKRQRYNLYSTNYDGMHTGPVRTPVRTTVLVYRSYQHNPYERVLVVSPRAQKRLAQLLPPGDDWIVGPPTPHQPRAILTTEKASE